jgi:hypothetical protein
MAMIDDELFKQCWDILRNNAPATLSMNHYELAQRTPVNNPQIWKEFLMIEDISEWLKEEREIMQNTELAKLTANISSSKSVGQAQLISALDRLQNNRADNAASGPAFVYCYIPLNAEQKQAPNVQILQEDIFYVEPHNTTGPKFEDPGTPLISN